MKRGLLLAWLVLVGCGSSSGGSSVVVLDRADPDFFARPYPRDDRRTAAGTLDVTGLPAQVGLVKEWMTALAEDKHGFGCNTGIFFRLSGAIDETTLPATADATLTTGASVFLVDLDHDRRAPVLVRFVTYDTPFSGPNQLAIMPVPGIALAPGTHYAAVVTTRVHAVAGGSVGRDSGFTAALAQPLYAPLRDWITRKGEIKLADVAGATVFTTGTPAAEMQALRDAALRDVPTVQPTVTAHTTQATYDRYDGSWSTPIYMSGTAPYTHEGGTLVLDGAGHPQLQGMETVRFTLGVPKTPAPAGGYPVLVYHHGAGGDRNQLFDPPADWMVAAPPVPALVAAGFVVLGFDSTMHGDRTPAGTTSVGDAANLENVGAARTVFQQSGVDALMAVRLVRSWPAMLALPETGLTAKLDPDRVVLVGFSRGAITSTVFLAREPGVRAVVLAGLGSNTIASLLGTTFPLNAKNFIKLALNEDVDLFDPFMSLFATILEPGDGANYLGEIFASPPAGIPSKSLLVIMGVTDSTVGAEGVRAGVRSARVPPVGTVVDPIENLALAGVQPIAAATVTGNGPGGTSTGAVIQVAANGYDGHFAFLRDPDALRRWIAFLASAVSGSGPPTLAP